MAKTIVVDWEWPTVDPAKHAPLKEALIQIRLEKTPPAAWSSVGRFPYPDTQARVENLPPGVYEVQGFAVDMVDQPSAPVGAIATIPFEAPPPLVNLTVSIE